MDAQMEDARINTARDEMLHTLQQQVQQLAASNANYQNQLTHQNKQLRQALQDRHQEGHKHEPRAESAKLPEFNGEGDVYLWIRKFEAILRNQRYTEDRWTDTAIECLKDGAKAVWYNPANEMGTDKIPWATFKKKLTEQFDYAHHQYDAWVAIRFLKYNTADDYINKFKRLAFKLPKMGEEDKKFDFLMNLPGHLRQKILGKKCKTLDDMCLLL
ncbi:hypothetical protein PCANC_17762 [Puccinia coronata f. sp. avenae]|uniref:Retrotransposon gag domain-containing protein n=1 Tax=Puccinia coronata f. sp. avenae TaxID=200324 RepID=A0A2N5UYR6_9BASI|nr:hypothetical protein PCANC_17762 [Puccinia coronata f. sp. avenae]